MISGAQPIFAHAMIQPFEELRQLRRRFAEEPFE